MLHRVCRPARFDFHCYQLQGSVHKAAAATLEDIGQTALPEMQRTVRNELQKPPSPQLIPGENTMNHVSTQKL